MHIGRIRQTKGDPGLLSGFTWGNISEEAYPVAGS